jgi:hypothetical protein
MPAVKELFRILGVSQNLDEHEMLKGMVKGTTKRVHQQSKYRQIWDIEIMFDHIRGGPPAENLDGSRLMGVTAFLLMALVPLRPISILRLDPWKERRRKPTPERRRRWR